MSDMYQPIPVQNIHTIAVSGELLFDAQQCDINELIGDVLAGRATIDLSPEPVASFPLHYIGRGVSLAVDECHLLIDSARCACGHLDVLHNRDDIGDTCPLCECTTLRVAR